MKRWRKHVRLTPLPGAPLPTDSEHETRWTLPALKEHYDQRFAAQERAVEAALSAAKEAVEKAEAAAEKRFELMNEFRGALSDQATTFVTRVELDQRLSAQAGHLSSLQTAVTDIQAAKRGATERRSGIQDNVGLVSLLVGIVVALIAVFAR